MNEITCPQCTATFNPEKPESKSVTEINRAIEALEAVKAELIGASSPAAADTAELSGLRGKMRQTLDFLGLTEVGDQAKAKQKSEGAIHKVALLLGLLEHEPAK
jgi:hypothetical protein